MIDHVFTHDATRRPVISFRTNDPAVVVPVTVDSIRRQALWEIAAVGSLPILSIDQSVSSVEGRWPIVNLGVHPEDFMRELENLRAALATIDDTVYVDCN